MKGLLLSFALLPVMLLSTSTINAQCPGCLIDTTQTAVGLYPDTLPDVTLNQPYDEDITFVMFTDTLGLTVNTFQILSVSGIPFGLGWECNNVTNGCVYDPSVSIYGCVKICGTPLQAGTFNALVTVIADVQIVGQQTVTFTLPITVLQGSGGNAGFTFTPAGGCQPLTINYNAIVSAYDYLWDFGNGVNDTGATPPPQVYATAGDYPVAMVSTVGFQLQSITVTGIPDNYGDLFGLETTPDLYFYIYDQNGNQVFDSHPTVVDQLPPYTWSGLNLGLTNQVYTLHLWDEDGILKGADDDLAAVSWSGNLLSGTLTATLTGVADSLVISFVTTPLTLTYNDTVHVFPLPAVPVIAASNNDSICEGDSSILSVAVPIGGTVQWYNDTTLMIGVNTDSIVVLQPGNYIAQIMDTNGCGASSMPYLFTVIPLPPKPNFAVNGNTLTCFVTGFNLQWYVNGIPIAGADSNVWTAVTPGYYMVIACNAFGCCTQSDSVLLTGAGIANYNNDLSVKIIPNPASSHFDINYVSKSDLKTDMKLRDVNSRIVFDESFELKQGSNTKRVNCNYLPAGVYTVEMKNEKGSVIRKLVIGR
ncbi:MAG: T9SS type A sorting domain-containing protein [Bacteroidia bacterium]